MRSQLVLCAVILALAFILTGCSDDDPTSPVPEGSFRVPADYATIQGAIDAASAGDTVSVAAGVYTALHEHTDFIGRTRQVAAVMKQGVVLRGATGDPADVIIDAEGRGWGIWFHEVDGATGLAGLTVRRAHWGISGYQASPWIDNCIIEDNGDADILAQAGTGMYFDYSSSLVTNCLFQGNVAESGSGAVFSQQSDVRFEDCLFTDNHSTGVGGGLSIGNHSRGTLVNCLITGNTAATNGGGLYCHGDQLLLINSAITGNTAGEQAGGIAIRSTIFLSRLENVLITGNTASDADQGKVWDYAAEVQLVCCTTDPEGWVGEITVLDEGCD